MKFLLHTQYYPPEMGAPQSRLSDLARRLKFLGHEVQVLTAMPNYPHGRIFEGYQGSYYRKEEKDGILIHRAMIIPSNRPNMGHRMLSYLSFCLSSFLVGFFKLKKPEIIITESPPLFLGISGWLLAKTKGARFILNISDLWPDSAKHIGMLEESSPIYKMLRGLAHFFYRRAWLVTGQSNEIINEISRQIPESKVYHLSNGVDPDNFSPKLRDGDIRKRYLKNDELGLIYAGLHGLFQGLEQILNLAEQMQGQNVRFLFFGDGPQKQKLIESVQERKLSNIDFYPALPHQEMPPILASMDIAIIPLKSRIIGAVPSKIYEAMASGLPILLIAEGEASEIIKNSNAGLSVSPNNFNLLVKLTQQLVADAKLRTKLGQAGRQAAVTIYNRMGIAQQFESELKRNLDNFSEFVTGTIRPVASARLTVHHVEKEVSYASKGYKILRSSDGGSRWETDGLVIVPWWKRLLAISPILSRITRERVYGVLPLPSGTRISLASGMIGRAAPRSSRYQSVFRFSKGTRPLNICRCPNGKIFWGEYFLNLRRSYPVHIYCSQDEGIHWAKAYTFPRGSICHIHRVIHDSYDGSLLICTGDRNNEVGIYRTQDEFRTMEKLVSGDQIYRTTSLIPCNDFLLYGTDNPEGQNFIVALMRDTNKIEKLRKIPGPVLYGCRIGDQVAFATMIENQNHEISIWAGYERDLRQVVSFEAKKYNWLFREILGYSTVILPEGRGNSTGLMCTPLGTLKYSGSLIEIIL